MNGEHFLPVYLGSTILLIVIVFFIISYVIIYARRQQAYRLEKAQILHDSETRVFKARLEEQERVMTQISTEIHDNVAQKVDFIQMNLKAIDDANQEGQKTRLRANSLSILEQVTADLRNISYSLNSDYIKDRGLGEVLERELYYIGESKNIDCKLRVRGLYKTLAPEQELLIYRIAQEALHNSVKHAQSSAININLQYGLGQFAMEVADDGIGFEQNQSATLNGLGFRNMQQRADLLGAKLDVDVAPGKGCKIILTMDTERHA